MKNETIRSGLRIYLEISCSNVADLLNGKKIQAWPTSPYSGGPGLSPASTQIRIDPDQFEIEVCQDGILIIQRKGVKNAKTAGKHDCNSFFCRAGRANRAKPKARKDSGQRRRPQKTTMRVPLENPRRKPAIRMAGTEGPW